MFKMHDSEFHYDQQNSSVWTQQFTRVPAFKPDGFHYG